MKHSLLKILLGAIIGAFIIRGCSSTPTIGSTTIKTVHHTDTVYSRHVDTIFVEGPTKYISSGAPAVEAEGYIVHSYNEDNLAADVTTYSDGHQDLSYSVICPEITNTDTITITNTDTITVTNTVAEDKTTLYVGGSGMISESQISGVGFNAGIKFRNDYMLMYQYNVQFNQLNQHEIRFIIPLRRKN